MSTIQPEAQPERRDLQASGAHPAPCARYCEAQAFHIELRRLRAYCQELEAQVIRDCMTHVQNPAENEHIADDMSKNETGSNTAQPAPPADSVLEDAERYRYLRDGTLVDGAINEDLYVHIDHQSYPNRWALVGAELDEAVDAARAAQKEGEKP